jgi:hypothetical protein
VFAHWRSAPYNKGRVEIDFCHGLPAERLNKTVLMIDGERQKSSIASKARGYQGFDRHMTLTESETAFFADYEWAIIRLATALPVAGRSHPPLLVFASVEFVHSDRPRPDSTPLDELGIPPHTRGEGPSGMRVYFRRAALAAADALRWYRDVAKGALTVPIPWDPHERGRHDGGPLRGPALVDEPPWSKLAFPIVDSSLFAGSKATYPAPFLGPGTAPARIHRLMAAADPDLEFPTTSPPLSIGTVRW